MSIRAIVRVTGVAKGTVLKLLVDLGDACAAYHDANVRNLKCKRVQCDEIWSFVNTKDKNVLPDEAGTFGIGSVWTWTAIDAETKLIASFHVGTRDAGCAYEFMSDLKDRLASRVQLTEALRPRADGPGPLQPARVHRREPHAPHRQPRNGARLDVVRRAPELTMRMSMRRFTRLTNGFSKKVENHASAVALHFMHYNFCRVHQTLRVTPAMAAGLTDRVWEISDLIALMPKPERAAWGSKKRAAVG